MNQVLIALTEAERERVYRFRYDVYVREMGKNLAAADHRHGRLTDPEDAEAEILYVADAHRVLGTLRLHAGGIPVATAARIGSARFGVAGSRMALVSKTMVTGERRGTLVFLALAKAAYLRARVRGVTVCFLHCRPDLVPLYHRMGCRAYGVEFVDGEVGPQVAMVLDLDPQAVRANASPLSGVAAAPVISSRCA